MNREQAEHILKAYVSMLYARDAGGGSDVGNAINSLREVILDAMTQYKQSTTQGITWPHAITVPATAPTNWDGAPKVTCTGIDPAFGINRAAVVE